MKGPDEDHFRLAMGTVTVVESLKTTGLTQGDPTWRTVTGPFKAGQIDEGFG